MVTDFDYALGPLQCSRGNAPVRVDGAFGLIEEIGRASGAEISRYILTRVVLREVRKIG